MTAVYGDEPKFLTPPLKVTDAYESFNEHQDAELLTADLLAVVAIQLAGLQDEVYRIRMAGWERR